MSFDAKIIKSSFEVAKPIGKDVVNKFYEFLWTDYPAAKALFEKTNMDKQKGALLNSLVFIVDNVEKPDKLLPYLKQMGARHTQYGTQESHYDLVGASLLKTFAFFFKDKWTAELKQNWTAAYGVIAKTMIEGAREKLQKKVS